MKGKPIGSEGSNPIGGRPNTQQPKHRAIPQKLRYLDGKTAKLYGK
jgi:hypothetical protein